MRWDLAHGTFQKAPGVRPHSAHHLTSLPHWPRCPGQSGLTQDLRNGAAVYPGPSTFLGSRLLTGLGKSQEWPVAHASPDHCTQASAGTWCSLWVFALRPRVGSAA